MNNVVLEELTKLLSQCEKYLDENNELLKSKVQSDVLNMDEELLSLLIDNEILKKSFFKEINGSLIFDKVSFSWTVNSSEFLPNSYTTFKNKIGLVDENMNYISRRDEVCLSFPYKDCLLEFDSTDETEQRDEVYLNEVLCKSDIDVILESKVLGKAKKYTKNSVNNVNTYNNESLIIKGNNLISLYSLLPKFEGQIKCMYWDILYNTDSDKVPYNDSFKHSSWLLMMKNRLEIARKLLNDDGLIFLQCDDNEMAYLKVLCDEIFSRDNFVNCIAVKMSPSSGVKRRFATIKFIKNKEYILVYKKKNISINPIYDVIDDYDGNYTIFFDGKILMPLSEKLKEVNPTFANISMNNYLRYPEIKKFIKENVDNIWRRHGHSKWVLGNICASNLIYKKCEELTSRSRVWKVHNPSNLDEFEYIMNTSSGYERLEPISWKFIDGELTLLRGDFWDGFESDMGNVGKEGGNIKLSAGKKPERLIKDIILCCTNPGDIVLDAYFGTGTTGAVALKLGRKFIGLEQLDSHFEKAIARLKNVINGDKTGISEIVNWQGGGEVVSCELLKQNEIWIDLVNNSTEMNINDLYIEVLNNPFVVNYKVNIDLMKTAEIIGEFEKLSFEDKKRVLIALIDKNNLYVNYSNRDDANLNVAQTDIEFSKSLYGDK